MGLNQVYLLKYFFTLKRVKTHYLCPYSSLWSWHAFFGPKIHGWEELLHDTLEIRTPAPNINIGVKYFSNLHSYIHGVVFSRIFHVLSQMQWVLLFDAFWIQKQSHFYTKVSKSRKQIMVSLILPKNERNSLKILSWVCLVHFLEESGTL